MDGGGGVKLLHKPYLIKWSMNVEGVKMSIKLSTWFMDDHVSLDKMLKFAIRKNRLKLENCFKNM